VIIICDTSLIDVSRVKYVAIHQENYLYVYFDDIPVYIGDVNEYDQTAASHLIRYIARNKHRDITVTVSEIRKIYRSAMKGAPT